MDTYSRGLLVALDVAQATVVVVGGDEEAERKIELLLDGEARVRVLAEAPTARIAGWAAAGLLEHAARPFSPGELDGARLVLVTPRDPALAAAVAEAARARGVLCWACDDPAASDLAMPAVARLGAARVAISTSGRSPFLAGRMRAALEAALGDTFARFVEALGERRALARAEEPDRARRRAALEALLDGFELELRVRYPRWFTS
jgi:siroheme synthase-like protein